MLAFTTMISTALYQYHFHTCSMGSTHYSSIFCSAKHRPCKKRGSVPSSPQLPSAQQSPDLPVEPLLPHEGEILDLNILSQLSFFIKGSTIFRRLRPLYSGGDAGFSDGSFEQKVLNWRAPSLLLVAGTRLPHTPFTGSQRAFADALPPKRFPDGADEGNGRVDE
jgi:hypothetical protein